MSRPQTKGDFKAMAARTSRTAGFKLPRRSTQPLYLQIKDAIKNAIAEGRLVAGQRLPAIRQICGELGVSYVTVARGISALAREGVLEASTTEGTRVAVRRRVRLETIGIVGVDPYQHLLERSRYYSAMLTELLHNVVQHSRTVVYGQWTDNMNLIDMFGGLSLVDGLILLGPDRERLAQIETAQRMGVPVVIIGKTYDDDVPTVDSANFDDTYRATRFLLEMGHRRVACVGPESMPAAKPTSLRHDGYIRAMTEARVGTDDRLTIAGKPRNLAAPLLKLDPPPTAAIVIGETAFLPELFRCLEGSHLRIGSTLYLCAYDDDLWNVVAPLGVDYMRIEQPIAAIARTAVDVVVRMLDDQVYHPGHIKLPATIVRVPAAGVRQVLWSEPGGAGG